MPVLVRPLYQDAFSPVLLSSEPLVVTDEQRRYIREILETGASDTRFAQKMYDAVVYVLTHGSVKTPTVTSLTPSSVALGSPTFDIHVHGTNFTSGSKIVFNGFEEPTTFVSTTEVTTGVNMDVWAAPAVVPVGVLSEDGVLSATQNFTFTEAGVQSASQQKVLQTPVKK